MTIAVRRLQRWLLLIIGLIAIGCSSDDQRLIEVSRQSLDRQAEQNRLVTTNNQQVIDATGKLVEADAQARRENIQLQHEIQSERSGINQQRDHLEQEHRQIAEQRGRDPIIAESIQSAVGLIVAALPLVVCLFVLRGLFHKSDDEAMADVLVEELVSYQPLFADPEGMRLPTDAGSRLLAPSLELGTSGVPLLREAPPLNPAILAHPKLSSSSRACMTSSSSVGSAGCFTSTIRTFPIWIGLRPMAG